MQIREEEARKKAQNRAKAYLMRKKGMSFSEIGLELGVTSQKAYQYYAKAERMAYVVFRNEANQRQERHGIATALFLNALEGLNYSEALNESGFYHGRVPGKVE